SNQGGNLDLTVEDELLLRERSRISATAGTAQGNGDGGNITVQSPFVIAIPAENSDITANAFQGNGGSIQITTQGIFGIESRDGRTPLSDITASSEFGLSGVVDINTPNVDPARGLVELPATPVDVAGLINQNFCRRGQESQFIITGQGGLPSSPNETLNPEMPWDDLRLVPEGESSPPIPVPSNNDSLQSNKTNSSEAIVEAQGWIVAPDGKIMLTSAPVTVTPQGVLLYPIDCQRLQNQS
ncbi:MAG TPA: S-layer family protein, partial [Allocoleopsis sp.]